MGMTLKQLAGKQPFIINRLVVERMHWDWVTDRRDSKWAEEASTMSCVECDYKAAEDPAAKIDDLMTERCPKCGSKRNTFAFAVDRARENFAEANEAVIEQIGLVVTRVYKNLKIAKAELAALGFQMTFGSVEDFNKDSTFQGTWFKVPIKLDHAQTVFTFDCNNGAQLGIHSKMNWAGFFSKGRTEGFTLADVILMEIGRIHANAYPAWLERHKQEQGAKSASQKPLDIGKVFGEITDILSGDSTPE